MTRIFSKYRIFKANDGSWRCTLSRRLIYIGSLFKYAIDAMDADIKRIGIGA